MAQPNPFTRPTVSPTLPPDFPPTALPVSSHSRKHTPAIKTSSRQLHHLAAQSVRHEIRSNLRQDWTWPPSPSQSSAPLRVTPSTSWRPRDSDSSAPPSPQLPTSSLIPPDPYKYDSPDSLEHLLVARKRKRRRMVQEEIEWNEGLATYLERRDAWVGARSNLTQISDTALIPVQPETRTSLSSSSSSSSSSPSSSPSRSSSPVPTLLPLPLPLFPPENPIRAAITPAAYTSIYSKVVTQGQTPTVPINLSDMVKALVQGWKENGEWPPKGEGQPEAKGKATAGTAAGGIRRSIVGEGKRRLAASEIKTIRDSKDKDKKGAGLAIRSVGKMKRALGIFDDGKKPG